jgi:hypothetical protein
VDNTVLEFYSFPSQILINSFLISQTHCCSSSLKIYSPKENSLLSVDAQDKLIFSWTEEDSSSGLLEVLLRTLKVMYKDIE